MSNTSTFTAIMDKLRGQIAEFNNPVTFEGNTYDDIQKNSFEMAERLISIADKNYLLEITNALTLYPDAEQELSPNASLLWTIILSALCITPPPELLQFFADKLAIPGAKLLQMADIIKERQKESGEPFLPGLEPTPPTTRYPAPAYIYPEYTTLPTAELFRTLHALNYKQTEKGAIAAVGVDPRPHKHNVYMAMLNALGEQYPITAADKNILISLGNLYGERKKSGATGIQDGAIITAADIIRRIRGLEPREKIDAETIAAVTRRMGYLSKLRVQFDFTQHFELRKKDIGDGESVELEIPDNMRLDGEIKNTKIRFSYAGNMVYSNTIEVEYENGRVERAWEILTPPIVFDYAQKIKQVATIETRLLDIRKRANSSRDVDAIKVYLLEQITAIKRGSRNNRVYLDKLFEDMRIEINNRDAKKRKTDIARRILTHFKTEKQKNGTPLIADVLEIKGKKSSILGFEIIM